jgi:hypothetical protein
MTPPSDSDTDSDASLPSATPMGSGYPVAPSSGDDSNTIHVATQTLSIWLLDHAGQRMGADPNADDPVDRIKGALYRLVLESGEVRWGNADANGLVVEYEVEATRKATLYWGEPDDKSETRPLADAPDDDWEEYFLYQQPMVFDCAPWEDGGDAARQLANMGYGDFDDPRSAFANDYGSSDDGSIGDAHDNGTPASGSGGGDAPDSGGG